MDLPAPAPPSDIPNRIGFVSTRLAGTDGVSLEVRKWARVLEAMGAACFFFAGDCDHPADRSRLEPTAHFKHPAILELTHELFGNGGRSPALSSRIRQLAEDLRLAIDHYVRDFELELLIVENAFSLPMNIPLGLALTQYIADSSIATIAHHHDFWWERERFAQPAAADYLRMAFPPTLPSVVHVVINSPAQQQLALRAAVGSIQIPNVMDFEAPPAAPGRGPARLRAHFEIGPDQRLVLQPTRIVPRKRIEQAIELVHRLESPAVLLVSHPAGDEGLSYQTYLQGHADRLGVRLILAGDLIRQAPADSEGEGSAFTLADAYQSADLVSYPSAIEGFGNALLEAFFYRRPLVVQEYPVFRSDILPKGFQVVSYREYLGEDTVRAVQDLLKQPTAIERMVDHNYRLGLRHYSFATLRRRIQQALAQVRRL